MKNVARLLPTGSTNNKASTENIFFACILLRNSPIIKITTAANTFKATFKKSFRFL